jgi:hypothetical protein
MRHMLLYGMGKINNDGAKAACKSATRVSGIAAMYVASLEQPAYVGKRPRATGELTL